MFNIVLSPSVQVITFTWKHLSWEVAHTLTPISWVLFTSGVHETANSISGITCIIGKHTPILHLVFCTGRMEETLFYGPLVQRQVTNGRQPLFRYQTVQLISRFVFSLLGSNVKNNDGKCPRFCFNFLYMSLNLLVVQLTKKWTFSQNLSTLCQRF